MGRRQWGGAGVGEVACDQNIAFGKCLIRSGYTIYVGLVCEGGVQIISINY